VAHGFWLTWLFLLPRSTQTRNPQNFACQTETQSFIIIVATFECLAVELDGLLVVLHAWRFHEHACFGAWSRAMLASHTQYGACMISYSPT
jgi:hypothetical protein